MRSVRMHLRLIFIVGVIFPFVLVYYVFLSFVEGMMISR